MITTTVSRREFLAAAVALLAAPAIAKALPAKVPIAAVSPKDAYFAYGTMYADLKIDEATLSKCMPRANAFVEWADKEFAPQGRAPDRRLAKSKRGSR